MSVKTEVLKLLEASRERDLSGQEMAESLGVTRSAIWKAVNTLKKEGYQIQAVNNRGYRLKEESDVLSEEGIRLCLHKPYDSQKIKVFKCIDSTNTEAKRCALNGEGEGLVILAEEQTNGRGRRGRSFYSPDGSGIYMSVLFRPKPEISQDVVLITTAASVAVCRAIRDVLSQEPEIKWVNDVYLNGKKICGILTEAVSDFESGRIDTVVVGIGINYHAPKEGYPDEIKEIAGTVCAEDEKIPRNELVAAIIENLCKLYQDLPDKSFMEDYRKWSNVLGKKIRFTSGTDWEYGTAVAIDEDGGLIVEKEDHTQEILHTGEITVRVC